MTCVAAIAEGGRCYLCGDSSASCGDERWALRRKVRRVGGVVLGVSGDVGPCVRVLTGRWMPRYDGGEPREWLGDELAPALVHRLRGLRGDVYVLIGCGGELWVADRHGALVEPADLRHAAIGSGADWAVGALAALADARPVASPRTRLRRALAIAGRYCEGVAPPWCSASC